jgi:FMN phosphatase YigB (HAD superfamily)
VEATADYGTGPVRIAVDIDSTLHHYWDQFASAAERRFGVALPYAEQTTWGATVLRPHQVKACVDETHTEPQILAAEPYPGAVEAIRAWHEAGHFIHVTSHRTGAAYEATARWLDGIGLPYDELYCSYDKVSRCAEIGIDVLVDDSPVNLLRALDAGMRAATILHPWNRDVCEDEDIVCARDWPELARRLEPVLA